MGHRAPARPAMAALICTLLFALAPVTAPTALAQGPTAGQREASRQLEFARAELEGGDAEASVRSATSALRLDPERVEAMVVKALALEQLGRDREARVLLSAYVGHVGKEVAEAAAREALARLSAPQPAPVGLRIVESRVVERAGDHLVMRFVAEGQGPAPRLSWRKPGGHWRQGAMHAAGEGRWELSVRLTGVLGGTVDCRVEPGSAADAARSGAVVASKD